MLDDHSNLCFELLSPSPGCLIFSTPQQPQPPTSHPAHSTLFSTLQSHTIESFSTNSYRPKSFSLMEELNDSSLLQEEVIGETLEKNDSSSVLSKCLPVVQEYFLHRMKTSLEDTFNLEVDTTGWRTVVVKRISGLTLGLLEVDYYNPEGKKCRNRTEVIAALSTLKKATKNTPREQHFVSAMEYREEVLLAQKLPLYSFTCDQIKYSSDDIVIFPVQPEVEQSAFFCIGNTTVISWGKVVSLDGFHTEHGIFPLGFRCVRQEHDMGLNCVVDCLLEVDALCKESSGNVLYHSSLASETNDLKSFATVEAVFRISVQWILPSCAKVVKVYEGKTPNTVWQAVKLETLGTTSEIPEELILTKQAGLSEEAERTSLIERDEVRSYILRSSVSIDSDEVALRAQLKEERKNYFKALHLEQRKGVREPLRPRLDIDNAENFVDHALMRMIEGMQGSLLCENYVFYESREETGIRVVWKEYTEIMKKMKLLDQVIRHYAIQAVQKELMTAKPRMEYEDNDAESKDVRAVILIAQKARSNKVRDIEKGVSSLRSGMAKLLKRRKDEVKLLLKNSLSAEDSGSQQPKVGGEAMEVVEATPSSLNNPRPRPVSGDVYMPGPLFSKLMELWVYLKAFTKSGEVVQALTIEHLLDAFTYVHPVMKEAAKRLTPRFLTVEGLNDKGKTNHGRNAEVLLNTIGVEMTKLIMSDFERLMGMESVEAYTGGLKVPINHLTWREIARITILAKVASGGFSENEISNMIKGRGFTTSPDNVDRKVLRLAKKRVLLQYHSRHEVQETMYGFRWGLCVKVPVPFGLYAADNRYWVFLHKTISSLNLADIWVLPELLRLSKYIRTANDGALVKFLACVNEVNSSVLESDSFPAFKDRLLRALEVCCQAFPSSVTHVSPISEVKSVVNYVKSHLSLALSRDIVEKFEEANALAVAAAGDGVDEDGVAPALPQVYPDVSIEAGEDTGETSEMPVVPAVNQYEEDDFILAEALSIPMKRCYFVLRTIMGHSEGGMLCYISSPLGYRRRSRYWATLREVRTKLVAGGYNSIERFYRDVIYVIELGYMCNWDNSNHRHTIAKLHMIFERLFFEMVICCQESLVYPDCCPYCRTSVPVPPARSAVCDRCEGVYHIDCLDPPLAFATKSEWTCPACVEQRWVAHAHPYRLARVVHPESHNKQGDVVGIELLNGEMIFVIDFRTSREVWSPSKVREYALPATADYTYDMPAGYTFEDYERTCCLCKAYVGYTTTFNIIPASLQEMYSKSMAAISSKDADFDTVRTGAALLSLDEVGTEEWLVVLQSLVVTAIRSPFNPINLPFSDDINGMVKRCLEDLKESEQNEDDFDVTENDDSSSMSVSLESVGYENTNDEDQEDDFDEARPIKKARMSTQSPLASELSEEHKDVTKSPNNPPNTNQDHHISSLMWKLIGREDALQANELVKEAVATLDLDFKSGTDMEDLQPMIKEQLGEFLPLAISTVIKSCTVKPAETTDLESWTEGWSETMEAVNFDLQEKPLVCALCNNTEEFLCNPMVHLPDQTSLSQRKHINWELVDYHEDIDEDVRIAHYFCAHTLHSLLSSKKVAKADDGFDAEDYMVVERVCTVGTPCLVPLGSDRDGSSYWVFKQSPYIFVQSGPAASRTPSLEEPSQLNCSWHIYKTDEEKAKLISWLLPGHVQENRLRRALVFLNPHWEGFLEEHPAGSMHVQTNTNKQATTSSHDQDNNSGEEEGDEEDDDDDEELIVNSTRSASNKKKRNKFAPKERVYAIGGVEPTQYWPADVLSVDTSKDDSIVYKVRYDDWDEIYDAYLNEEELLSEEDFLKKMGNVVYDSNQKAESAVAISRKAFLRKQVFTAPQILFSLQASSFLRIPDRECGQRPPMGFSSCLTPLEQIRAAMFIIEAALPCGSVDDSEDRWADDFVVAWREAVMTASDPTSLMQCQILLEFGIRTSWLKPTGLKLFSCLPSRAQSLKQATYGMVAIRVWLLDMTIKYDKVQLEKKEKTAPNPDSVMNSNLSKKKKKKH